MSSYLNSRSGRFPFVKLLVLLFAFRALMDVGYSGFVVPVFGYDGYELEWNALRFLVSLIAIFFAALLVIKRRDSALINIYFIILVLVMIPASSFYALGKADPGSFFANIFVYCGLVTFLPKTANFQPNFSAGRVDVFYASWLFAVITIFMLVISSGGRFVIAFEDVYDFRAENTRSGISAYITNWSAKLIAPFLLSYAIVSRRLGFIFAALLLTFLLYIFTGHKSVLAPIGFSFLVYIALRSKLKRGEKEEYGFFTASLLILLIFSGLVYLLYIFYQQIVIPSIFFRRTYFTPAFLNSVYFEMFSAQGFVYWSNTFMGSFIDYPYSDTITHEVGAYLGKFRMGANTGFVASGYMQAGYFGVLAYFLIMAFFNFFVSKHASKVNPLVFNSIFFMPFLALFSSSDLPTTMLTHALAPAAGLLFFLGNRAALQNPSTSRHRLF